MKNKAMQFNRNVFYGNLIFTAIFAVQIFAQNTPPKAEVRSVTDEYFGQKIVDPYRWMEDLKSDEMQKWMRGQADYTNSYLKKIPSRDECVSNIQEFGSVKTEEGFRNLLAMDGYQKIKDGVKYPAALLTHGANDPRVDPWLSAKFAARLQAATASGKPVLLRLDYDAGHGIGSSRKQRNEENADIYAFLYEQLGGK